MKKEKKAKVTKAPAVRKSRKKALTPEQVKNLFYDQLHQRYWAEKELILLLPRLVKRATSYELATAIQEHLIISEQQIIRLIHVFDSIEERASGCRSIEIENLIMRAEEIITGNDFGFAGDTAIIEVCQAIMQLEIESYSRLRELARLLNESTAAQFLENAIEEENSAHKMLTQIALSAIYFNQAG